MISRKPKENSMKRTHQPPRVQEKDAVFFWPSRPKKKLVALKKIWGVFRVTVGHIPRRKTGRWKRGLKTETREECFWPFGRRRGLGELH